MKTTHRFVVAACICGWLAFGAASDTRAAVIQIGLSSTVSVQADLPLPTVDLTAAAATDWALWGLDQFDTPGDLTPDAEKVGGTAIGPLAVLNGDPIVDFSQFSLSPPFSWTDGDGIPTGASEAAAMVSRSNGVGTGFTIPVDLATGASRVRFYAQAFQAEGTFTVDFGTGTAQAIVESDTPGVLGDSGFVFTIDVVTDAPTTLDLRWEMTADLGISESVGLSAITVGAIPEPTASVLTLLGLVVAGGARSRLGRVDPVE